MQKTWATHFDVVGSSVSDLESDLGQHQEGRDLVSICPAVFGLRALDSLSLLPDLNGLSRRGDVWSSAGLGQPEQRLIPCVASLLSRAQPHPCAAMTA